MRESISILNEFFYDIYRLRLRTMPKTKLGTEIKNYGYKKVKTSVECSLSPELDSAAVVQQCRESYTGKTAGGKAGCVRTLTSPYWVCVVDQVLQCRQFLQALQAECYKLKFQEKSNDLYQFRQSPGLTAQSGEMLARLRARLLHTLRPWITSVMGIELETETVDMFCAQYSHTHNLLCHDDELEGRRIAFILYLSEESWTEEDGGLLELFTTDKDGNPGVVEQRLVPNTNSLVMFEVSPVSFHAVSEVMSASKTRLSVGGWFRGASLPRPDRVPVPASPCLPAPHQDMEDQEFLDWLNPLYIQPDTQGDIQAQFEESSEISLAGFLTEERYEAVCRALVEQEDWAGRGPPDRRHCLTPHGPLHPVLQAVTQLFTSQQFFLLLSNLTGLKLHELAPDPSDTEQEEEEEELEEKEEKVSNPRCRGGFHRWAVGCYSLVRDDDQEQAEYALDLRLCFNCAQWREEAGGQVKDTNIDCVCMLTAF